MDYEKFVSLLIITDPFNKRMLSIIPSIYHQQPSMREGKIYNDRELRTKEQGHVAFNLLFGTNKIISLELVVD